MLLYYLQINQFVNGSTCLHVAVFNADTEIVEIFLEKHADLSIQVNFI